MNLIRWILVAGTLFSLASLLSLAVTGPPTGWEWLWYPTVVIGFALNLVYLIRCPPGISKSPSRLRTLFSLWLDAKERELRDRAGKS
jgi:hypothetical protein